MSAASPSVNSAPSKSTPHKGLLLVISGPSGVGKTTITHEVERRLNGTFSVSATTRPKTAADVEGRDYYFLTDEQFAQWVREDRFLEHASVFGKYSYGTPREPVVKALAEGKLMILEIDVQGAQQVKRAMPEAFMVFVLPPGEEVLLNRLRARARDTEEAIQRRFAEAKREIETARSCGLYDLFIVNDDLQTAVADACAAVQARMNAQRTLR
ncbi:MAG TPA: guanylate kinase [Phycisphaerales bacterium]|nr:guanylate kinase [Phycisphaerales bacterium]